MKKLLTAVLVTTALLTATYAYSDDATPRPRKATKEIAINPAFHKIVAGNNIQLVLIQGAYKASVIINGDKNSIELVNVSMDKGVLTITAKKNLKGRNVKIYVPVTTLTSLDVAGDASVTTQGIVKLDDLKVIVQDGSLVNLHVIGNMHIEPGANCEFVYETYRKAKVLDEQE